MLSSMAEAEPAPRGRRPGESGTRAAILQAARTRFTSNGYVGATIRGIAGDAGVDPALVHHFFGDKEQLFAAAMDLPINPQQVLTELLEPGVDGLGERLVRFFLRLFRELGDENPMLALLRSAASHPDAARMLREFYSRAVLERLATRLDTSQPRLRGALCVSQILGLLMARQVIGLRPLTKASDETLVAAYAPAIQHYLTGPLPDARPARKRGG
jgi:AcrR family transcriptional regulator